MNDEGRHKFSFTLRQKGKHMKSKLRSTNWNIDALRLFLRETDVKMSIVRMTHTWNWTIYQWLIYCQIIIPLQSYLSICWLVVDPSFVKLLSPAIEGKRIHRRSIHSCVRAEHDDGRSNTTLVDQSTQSLYFVPSDHFPHDVTAFCKSSPRPVPSGLWLYQFRKKFVSHIKLQIVIITCQRIQVSTQILSGSARFSGIHAWPGATTVIGWLLNPEMTNSFTRNSSVSFAEVYREKC